MTTAELLRCTADKLELFVVPAENEREVRLMCLHICRVLGDPYFVEEARLLRDMLEG